MPALLRAVLGVLLVGPALAAQIQHETDKAIASDDDTGDRYGSAVCARGALAIVGAPRDDEVAADAGAAYVLALAAGGVTEVAKLTAANGAAGDELGGAVSVDGAPAQGAVAAVGAKRHDAVARDAGAVHVFRRGLAGWSEETTLTAPDGAALDQLGAAVAVLGDTLIAGAPNDDDDGSGSGAAYVFRFDGLGWSLEQKLSAADGAAGDNFGAAVDLGFDVCVVGALGDDAPGLDAGSAYVFRRSGTSWTQEAKLLPADGAAGDLFGRAVALGNDLVVVGASHDDDLGPETGAAYAFRRSGGAWLEEHKFAASDLAPGGDNFGHAVAVCGELCVISSIGDDDNGLASGSAYAFVRGGSGWQQTAKLLSSDGAQEDELGGALSVSGDFVLAGARLDDDGGGESGAAYLYTGLAPDPWADLGLGLAGAHGVPALGGAGALCGGDLLTLSLGGALQGTTATIVLGVSRIDAPFKGGILVPAPDVLVPGLPTGPAGAFVIEALLPTGIPAGITFYLQCWVSDPAGPAGFAASNGLAGTTS